VLGDKRPSIKRPTKRAKEILGKKKKKFCGAQGSVSQPKKGDTPRLWEEEPNYNKKRRERPGRKGPWQKSRESFVKAAEKNGRADVQKKEHTA